MPDARSSSMICPHCGYDLRGLSENRCPECGEAFDPNELGRRTPALSTSKVLGLFMLAPCMMTGSLFILSSAYSSAVLISTVCAAICMLGIGVSFHTSGAIAREIVSRWSPLRDFENEAQRRMAVWSYGMCIGIATFVLQYMLVFGWIVYALS